MNKHLMVISLAASVALADTFTLGQIDVQGTKEPINMMTQKVTAKQTHKQIRKLYLKRSTM